jgi:hypothetical protein
MQLSTQAINKLEAIKKTALEAEQLTQEYAHSGIFNFFRLRPKDGSIQLVSFLPDYPMRGGPNRSVSQLRTLLDKIAKRCEALGDVPPQEEDLNCWGFNQRQHKTDTYREDDVQAAFCLQMQAGNPHFDGIRLVASEFLLLEANKRIDVLGIKDSVLYIFELKKERCNSAYNQVKNYKAELQDNLDRYFELLRHYPNMGNAKPTDVFAAAVMPYAKNHQLDKPAGISHWLYTVPQDNDFKAELSFEKQ